MSNLHLTAELHDTFVRRYGQPDVCVRSPGRINLLGEHTDYNDGYVMPAAIDLAVYIAASKRSDQELKWFAADLNQTYEGNTEQLSRSTIGWPDYWLGAIQQLQMAGHKINGFNAIVKADLPIGAGLSSSAALTCGILFALNQIFDLNLPTLQIIRMAQATEQSYIGLQCGIMDQFANMMGRADEVILLDCRSLDYRYVPFHFSEMELVLLDTGVKHSLASSAYNRRREECLEGVLEIKKNYPAIQSLRDATINMVKESIPFNSLVYKRCIYVVQENERVLQAAAQLPTNDFAGFGKNMFATHTGLSTLYEVSCEEADFLVDLAQASGYVLGARMMGGGFGGCVLVLVPKANKISWITLAKERYHLEYARTLVDYSVAIGNGTSCLHI